MTKDEALGLALKALKWSKPQPDAEITYDQDITSLRQAIEQAQQAEPCGLECDCTDVCKQTNYKALWQQMCERCDELDKKLAQQEQTPQIAFDAKVVGYVTPRQWIGLTPQERDDINEKVYGAVPHHVAFHHAIEARLKELNT